MSQQTRPYLNLKASVSALFKTDAYYLKEQVRRWSIFEKPYLDQDYRQMHLNLSIPSWKMLISGDYKDKSRYGFFGFDRSCSVISAGGDCTKEFPVFVSIRTAYVEEGTKIAWDVEVEQNMSGVHFLRVEPDGTSSLAAKLIFSVDDCVEDDTVTICVKARISSGGILAYTIIKRPPLSFFVGPESVTAASACGFAGYGPFEVIGSGTYLGSGSIGSLGGTIPPAFTGDVANLIESAADGFDCGCVDVNLICPCCEGILTWDDAYSADTIGRSTTAPIGVEDSVPTTGRVYTWSVSGTGFSLAAEQTIHPILTNTLIAGPTACGTATITVEGCTKTTGYVRCTYGNWTNLAASFAWPYEPAAALTIVGKYRLLGSLVTCASGGASYCPGLDPSGNPYYPELCETRCNNEKNAMLNSGCCSAHILGCRHGLKETSATYLAMPNKSRCYTGTSDCTCYANQCEPCGLPDMCYVFTGVCRRNEARVQEWKC